jgi:hypothetical protein
LPCIITVLTSLPGRCFVHDDQLRRLVAHACDHTITMHDQQDEQIVLGVDTHADTHVAAVITVLGTVLETRSFPATPPATPPCWTGPAATEGCAGLGWRAPVPTAPPSTGT